MKSDKDNPRKQRGPRKPRNPHEQEQPLQEQKQPLQKGRYQRRDMRPRNGD